MVNKRSVPSSALLPTTLLAFLQHSSLPFCVTLVERFVVPDMIENVVTFGHFSLTGGLYIEREIIKSGLDSIQGLWCGQMCGMVVQMVLLLAITLCTNWDKEVRAYLKITTHLVY